MAHTNTIAPPEHHRRRMEQHRRLDAAESPPLDFALPLLSNTIIQPFRTGRGEGRIHAQRMSKDNDNAHPEWFYVEWPANSGCFRQIHAPKLARIAGAEPPAGTRFTCSMVRELIQSIRNTPVPMILKAAAR